MQALSSPSEFLNCPVIFLSKLMSFVFVWWRTRHTELSHLIFQIAADYTSKHDEMFIYFSILFKCFTSNTAFMRNMNNVNLNEVVAGVLTASGFACQSAKAADMWCQSVWLFVSCLSHKQPTLCDNNISVLLRAWILKTSLFSIVWCSYVLLPENTFQLSPQLHW